eukprot:413980-Amphidinium_carterae.1
MTEADIFALDGVLSVSVLMSSHHDDGLVATYDQLLPLPYVLAGLRSDMVRERDRGLSDTPRDARDVQLHGHSSAASSSMEGSAGMARSKMSVGSGAQVIGDFSVDAPEGTAEEDWDTVFAEIADARDAVSAEDVHASEHFRVGLLAGQWQVARTGGSVYGL